MRPSPHSHSSQSHMVSIGRKMSVKRFLLVAITAAFAAMSASVSSAAVASCAAKPHDAATPVGGDPDEIDVSCTAAINQGSITIGANRGDRIYSRAVITNGSGALNCSANNQPPAASGFDVVITCAGSLSSGATARLYAQFGPNPCQSPAFAGKLTVAFGDGTSFGPSSLSSYVCSGTPGRGSGAPAPKRQRRSITLTGVGQSGASTAGATGFLRARDRFIRCVTRAPVLIQRRLGGRWLTVGHGISQSSSRPDNSVAWFINTFPLRGGSYRAVAPQRSVAGHVCLKAVSRTVGGPPGVP